MQPSRFFSSLGFILIFGFLLMLLIGFNGQRRFADFEQQQQHSVYIESRYTKEVLERYLQDKQSELRRFEKIFRESFINLRIDSEVAELHEKLSEMLPDFVDFAIVDQQGRLFFSSADYDREAVRDNAIDFVGNRYLISLHQRSPEKPLQFDLILAIGNSGRLLVASFTAEEISNLLSLHISTNQAFLLADDINGRILLSSIPVIHTVDPYLTYQQRALLASQFVLQGTELMLASVVDGERLNDERRVIFLEAFLTALLIVILFVILHQRIRRDRQKVATAENLMHEIFHNIPGMVFKRLLDADQVIHYPFVSSGSESVFNHSPVEVMSSPGLLQAMIYPDDIDRVMHELTTSAVHLSPVKMDYRIQLDEFDVRWVRETSQPIHDDDWDVIWHGVILDITELKNIEEELRHSQKMDSVGQLAAGIAHEINTPTQFVSDNIVFLKDAFDDLAVLIEFCIELGDGKRTFDHPDELRKAMLAQLEQADVDFLLDEIPQAISQTRDGLERVTRIVRAMKEFSHPSSALKTSIDINHVIDNAVTIARNEWKYVATLELDLADDLPLLQADAQLLGQVFLNMIVNAAHAIEGLPERDPETKGLIAISSRFENNQVVIRISDSGTGVPEKLRSRIFEPFFTTKEVGKGSGQGLAIAYSAVVDQHNGSIDLQSEIGSGSTFIIRLPLLEDA